MAIEKFSILASGTSARSKPADTEVQVELRPNCDVADKLATIIGDAKRNLASRNVDYDSFRSDSAYLDALDAATDEVSIVDLKAKGAANTFFCRARISDDDRRIFVRNICAPNAEAAKILMAWTLAKLLSVSEGDALADFADGLEIDTPAPTDASDVRVAYVVESPKGDDVPVELVRPAKARMIDDVAEAFIHAAVIDPTIDPAKFTSIRKPGATSRYYIEAKYSDGDDYRDWVHAADEEEAEFQAACAVEANQSGNAEKPVIENLGDFIDGVDEIRVPECHLEPVTKDELLKAVRGAISAYDGRSGLADAMNTLRDLTQSMST